MSDWKDDLKVFFEDKELQDKKRTEELAAARTKSGVFLSETVLPAYQEIQNELEKYGRAVSVSGDNEGANIQVIHDGIVEFDYWIKVDLSELRPYPEIHHTIAGEEVVLEGTLRVGVDRFSIADITKDEIIASFLADYYAHIA